MLCRDLRRLILKPSAASVRGIALFVSAPSLADPPKEVFEKCLGMPCLEAFHADEPRLFNFLKVLGQQPLQMPHEEKIREDKSRSGRRRFWRTSLGRLWLLQASLGGHGLSFLKRCFPLRAPRVPQQPLDPTRRSKALQMETKRTKEEIPRAKSPGKTSQLAWLLCNWWPLQGSVWWPVSLTAPGARPRQISGHVYHVLICFNHI